MPPSQVKPPALLSSRRIRGVAVSSVVVCGVQYNYNSVPKVGQWVDRWGGRGEQDYMSEDGDEW